MKVRMKWAVLGVKCCLFLRDSAGYGNRQQVNNRSTTVLSKAC
jgi:hypothetical protein